jgi:uncharacterized membrane protein
LEVAVVAGLPAEAADLAVHLVAVELAAAVAPGQAGNSMRTKQFLNKLDHDRIVQAIREAESKTSGQIRVFIQRGELKDDPLAAAQKKFRKLGMQKASGRNAVLIFVAPRAHKFAIVGDKAIHEKCGEQLWRRLVDGMRERFKNEEFSHALVEAIEEVGKALSEHFPRETAT